MSYEGKSLDEIKKLMDERWKAGDAYKCGLPWDVMRHEYLQNGVVDIVSKVLVDFHGDFPLNAVDLGCGVKTVFSRQHAADSLCKFRDVRLSLVDISETAIQKLRSEYGPVMSEVWGERLSASYFVCPAEEMAKHVGKQHLVVSVESIEHWVDLEACLNGIRETLLPGGFFVLTTPNRDSLHVRMARKLGFEPPFCAEDHTYEFGHEELDRIMLQSGFEKVAESGVGFAPYWALEAALGHKMRQLTDTDPEIIGWLQSIGERCPEFSFCQVKAYQRV